MSGKNPRIEVNYGNAGLVLRSDELKEVLLKCAGIVAGNAAGSYETTAVGMGTRNIAVVMTTDEKTIQENLDHNTLLKGCHL